MNVTINSINNKSITVATAATTISGICSEDAVIEFFDESPETIAQSLTTVGGSGVSDGLRNLILNSPVSEGMELEFELVAGSEDDDDDNEGENDGPAIGDTGIVTVYTNGGMQSTNVEIRNGQTTLREAVFNEAVRIKSGCTDTQLSACTIYVNDEERTDLESVVRIGDDITLSLREARSKGC